ncbi:MAG: SagB/ThcOx family dehydrogenase [Candidatus Thorarchaeota archaeon]|nr:SagB/ThcOx family dehydrogenase [Candidatus Thorarchaeota archaeon]
MLTYGDDFLKNSKYSRGKLPRHQLDWMKKPPVFKEYLDAEYFSLPPPLADEGEGIWTTLRRRRSVRAYTANPISIQNLSQLLWATQGITGHAGDHLLRTAPSAGALYPVETYLSINRVTGLEPGLYHYSPPYHRLDLIAKGDFAKQIRAGALDQQIAERSAVTFLWSVVFQRSKWKYLQRAYRYIFLDAGHIAQNLALAAEALGLGSCQIGAIYDDELNDLLGLDSVNESIIYLSTVGHPRREI